MQTSLMAPCRVPYTFQAAHLTVQQLLSMVPFAEGKHTRQKKASQASERGKTVRREAAAAMQARARDKQSAAARQVNFSCQPANCHHAPRPSILLLSARQGFQQRGVTVQAPQEIAGLSDNVHCGQCSLILAGPHRLQCCHVFCGSCLDACLGNAMECPTCR